MGSARAMLAGALEPVAASRRRARTLAVMAAAAIAMAGALLAGSAAGIGSDVGAFFGAGVLLLASMLGVMAVYLRRTPVREITNPGWLALARLGEPAER